MRNDKHSGEAFEVAEQIWEFDEEVVHEVQLAQRREVAKACRERRDCIEEPRAVTNEQETM